MKKIIIYVTTTLLIGSLSGTALPFTSYERGADRMPETGTYGIAASEVENRQTYEESRIINATKSVDNTNDDAKNDSPNNNDIQTEPVTSEREKENVNNATYFNIENFLIDYYNKPYETNHWTDHFINSIPDPNIQYINESIRIRPNQIVFVNFRLEDLPYEKILDLLPLIRYFRYVIKNSPTGNYVIPDGTNGIRPMVFAISYDEDTGTFSFVNREIYPVTTIVINENMGYSISDYLQRNEGNLSNILSGAGKYQAIIEQALRDNISDRDIRYSNLFEVIDYTQLTALVISRLGPYIENGDEIRVQRVFVNKFTDMAYQINVMFDRTDGTELVHVVVNIIFKLPDETAPALEP